MGAARTHRTPGIVLDTGALIAWERSEKRMIALVQGAEEQDRFFIIPAGVLAQAWRNGRMQARLSRLLQKDSVRVVSLDADLARACGELCASTGTADIIDASVAIVAREADAVIVTSDPGDFQRLDPDAVILLV